MDVSIRFDLIDEWGIKLLTCQLIIHTTCLREHKKKKKKGGPPPSSRLRLADIANHQSHLNVMMPANGKVERGGGGKGHT